MEGDEPPRKGGRVVRVKQRLNEPASNEMDGCAPNLCTGWRPFALFLSGGFFVFLFLYLGLGAQLPRSDAAAPPA